MYRNRIAFQVNRTEWPRDADEDEEIDDEEPLQS